jgi:hypothetical protein
MSRLPARRTIQSIQWAVLLELAELAHDHWGRLTPGERAHLAALLRTSRGNPGRLSAAERRDIRRLAAKLDLFALGRRAAPVARRLRARPG